MPGRTVVKSEGSDRGPSGHHGLCLSVLILSFHLDSFFETSIKFLNPKIAAAIFLYNLEGIMAAWIISYEEETVAIREALRVIVGFVHHH